MKNLYKSVAFTLVVVLQTSCSNFLDLKPISQETSDLAYNTASQIEAALVGAYESFQAEYYVWDNVLFQDVRSDNHYAGGDNPEVFQIDWLTITPTNSRLFTNWSNIYNAIAKANLVIEKTPLVNDATLLEERRQEIIAEAHFLRAYHYYVLVNKWGGVPLIINFTASADPEDVRVPRSSVEEVYDQIMLDLEFALSILPDTYGADASINKARATSGAANALAAKVCLQRPNPNYTLALEYINAIEKSEANYKLIEYSQLFDGNHYNNAESILEIQYLGGNEGNYGPQLLLPPSISGDAWRKFVTPSQDLVNAFDAEGDEVRKNATIIFEAAGWSDEYWGNSVGSTIPFAFKWKSADGWASSNRPYIFRYGDIVLLKAEALAQLGRLNDAASEVNRIRSRVGLNDLESNQTADKNALLTAILNERRLELAQEAQRWDDLVRFNKVVEVMNSLKETDLRNNQLTEYNMTTKKILLPIPQEELDRNPELTQN